MQEVIPIIVVIAALVLVEFFAFRIYKKVRTRKEALFTKEQLGTVYDDLQSTRRWLLEEKRALRLLSELADREQLHSYAPFLDVMAKGVDIHLEKLEEFRHRLHAEKVDVPAKKPADHDFRSALDRLTSKTADWADDICLDYASTARLKGYKDISKMYRQFQQVAYEHVKICKSLAEDSTIPAHSLLYCPGCGSIVSGRYPAFCSICTNPGFEFKSIERV